MKYSTKMNKALRGSWKGVILLVTLILYLSFVPSVLAVTLEAGDLIVADFNGGGGPVGDPPGGRIIKVDPSTGAQTMISSGNLLDGPVDVAIDAAGSIIVLDNGDDQVIKVDPSDGSQTVISEGGLFVNPMGIAIDAAGNIIVADQLYGGTGGIIKVHPTTGVQTVISSGGSFNIPSDVTIDAAGNLYVTSAGVPLGMKVVKVDPVTGAQTVISSGTFNTWYSGIVIDDSTGNIFVAEIYHYNGIFKVDPLTGVQSVLSSGSPFQDPYQLDIDSAGNLVAADSGWWGTGNIIKVDPSSGAKAVISSGGLLVDPAGIVVYEHSSNQPPVADAGPDQTVIVGQTVTFDASGSYDPDGTIVSYEWDFDDDTTGSGEITTHEYSLAGVYTATLTVTDNDAATDTDTAIVTVQTPAEATQDLILYVLIVDLPNGIEDSLVSKLEAAIKSLDKGRENAAKNQLNAVINQVEAQRGNKISDADADVLIAAAQEIIATLSSP